MPDTVKYILDANIFIEAKRRYYAFELCPGFWDSLLYHNSNGNLESIDRVKKELAEGKDLDDWMKKADTMFATTDTESVITIYKEIIQWAHNQRRFSEEEKSKFADDVDPWVIAHSKANSATVVTHEAPAPKSTKIKIPDVCKAFDIKCTNTFDMLKKLNIVFNWLAP